jgi:hypothetical protein
MFNRVYPTEQDKKNYDFKAKDSPYYSNPGKWLREGDRVRAKFRIFDLPGKEDDWGWVSAEAGEEGVVVHVEDSYWPTVKFANGRATCVTDFEVEELR